MSVLGEFDDLALLQAFSQEHDDLIYISPRSYQYVHDFCETHCVLGDIDELKEEYYVIFAERMVQHPIVQKICDETFGQGLTID
jgi:LysR family transcriptional activator of nhaA